MTQHLLAAILFSVFGLFSAGLGFGLGWLRGYKYGLRFDQDVLRSQGTRYNPLAKPRPDQGSPT